MARKLLILTVWLVTSFILAPEQARAGEKTVELIRSRTEKSEERILDVGVRVFSPGIPENAEAIRKMEEEGVSAAVRGSEARYIPVQLVHTLQASRFWGTVRVIPDAYLEDVVVSGTILYSKGYKLKLKITVVDSRGKVWLKKTYKGRADNSVFSRKEFRQDPYQSLYNRIANDIRKASFSREDDDIVCIRTLSRLRYAADLVPAAFNDYVSVNKKRRYSIEKLPARDDPMMARIMSVRLRDQMFIDRLNEHYSEFHAEMREPYDQWRELCYDEHELAKKLERRAFLDKFLGVSIVVGGVAALAIDAALAANSDGVYNPEDSLTRLIVDAGKAVYNKGKDRSAKARMHRETMREFGISLDKNVDPALVEFEGEVIRFQGTVEAQYSSWRKLLLEIFKSETGLPVIPDREVVKEARVSESY